jgi:hypothetical protein
LDVTRCTLTHKRGIFRAISCFHHPGWRMKVQSFSCCWVSTFGRNNCRMQVTVPHYTCHNPRRRQYESVSELVIFEPNIYLHKYPSNRVPVILPAYTTYDDGTVCSETSAHKIQTPGGSPKWKNTTFRTRRRFEIKNVYLALRSLTNSSTKVFFLKLTCHIWRNSVSRGLIRTKIKIPQYVFAPNITLHCNSFVIHPFLHPLTPASPDSSPTCLMLYSHIFWTVLRGMPELHKLKQWLCYKISLQYETTTITNDTSHEVTLIFTR